MVFHTANTNMDFGVLGNMNVDIEYSPAGGEAIIYAVWVEFDGKMVDIFALLTDADSDVCFDIARQDWNDRRQDAAEYMEER